MNLIALDTSSDACSAALLWDGCLAQRLELAPRRHGALILEMLQGLLEQAAVRLQDLDAIAFGRGPGSFTGVRIAVSVAQGAAFGAGLPVVPVSTLAALALGAYRRDGHRRLLAGLDARMGEVYWGAFEIGSDGTPRALGLERVCRPGEVPLPEGGGWWGLGSGWRAHAGELGDRLGGQLIGTEPEAICEAADIARIAAALGPSAAQSAELAQPLYLRDRVTG